MMVLQTLHPQSQDVEASAEKLQSHFRRFLFGWTKFSDLVEVFKPRASVMKSVPKFFCATLRIV